MVRLFRHTPVIIKENWLTHEVSITYNPPWNYYLSITFSIPMTLRALKTYITHDNAPLVGIATEYNISNQEYLREELRIAARTGSNYIVSRLLEHNAQCFTDYMGCTIGYALHGGHPDTVLFLLSHFGRDIPGLGGGGPGRFFRPENVTGLLECAVNRDYGDVVKALLEYTNEIGQSLEYVKTVSVLNELLAKQTNISEESLDTALRIAAMAGRVDITQRLLAAGATSRLITNKELRVIRFVDKSTAVSDLLQASGREITGRRTRIKKSKRK